MTVSKKCKLGPSVFCNAQRIIQGLQENRLESGIWTIITTSPVKDETLYILSKSEMKNGLYDFNDFHVVALAGNQSEAFQLIRELVQEACDQDRLYELKQFFLEY